MDNKLNEYLGRVERRLRPLPAVERADIVKEIQSEMLELQADGAAPEQIVARLGDPRVLARSYLGDNIVKQRRFTWRKFGALLAFYSLAGAGWTIVLPVTSICAAAFLLSGALCPIAGIVKFAVHLMGYDLPVIGIQIGSYSMAARLLPDRGGIAAAGLVAVEGDAGHHPHHEPGQAKTVRITPGRGPEGPRSFSAQSPSGQPAADAV